MLPFPAMAGLPVHPAATEACAPPSNDVLGCDFLDEAGPCAGARVLVLGDRRAEVMGGLIRRGCLAAMSLQRGAEPECGAFDVVVATSAASGDELAGIVHSTWRALKPRGRVVACLVDAARGGASGPELERRLRLHGFGDVRTRPFGRSLVLRAVLAPSDTVARHA